MIEITQEIFESYVPSFSNATGEVFLKVKTFIADAEQNLQYYFGIDYEQFLPADCNIHVKAVCLNAAYNVFSHMDLVLTPTGFGIVRNDHLTPASRERTEALREDLRKSRSANMDMLLFTLLQTDWGTTGDAMRLADSLLFCPSMLRRYGIKSADGKEIYHEEMQLISAKLAETAAIVERIISPELYAVLVERQRIPKDSTAESLVTEATRKLQSALMKPDYHKSAYELEHRLKQLLERYSQELPDYSTSSTYAAYHATRYENKKEDPTYFFG